MRNSFHSLICKVLRRLNRLYSLYVRRDPFLREIRRWSKARGDLTLRLDYPLDKNSVVFDVGGYIGDFADRLHNRFGCRIYLFEPSPDFFSLSQSRFSNEERIKCFNYGLGGKNDELALSSEGDASSLVKKDSLEAAGRIVSIRSFAEVMTDLDVAKIDLLKINIEGAEYELLQHILDRGLVTKICHIQVQFHNFVDGADTLRSNIRAELAKTHKEHWCYKFVSS